jgi:hypothetical protein
VAVDALEEGRVRNAIGELSDAAWAERRDRMEDAVNTSKADLIGARQEADRLLEVLGRLGHGEPETPQQSSPAPATHASAPEPAVAAAGLDDEATVESWDEEIFPENTDGFLEAIDRALSDDMSAHADPGLHPRAIQTAIPEDAEADTAPKPGLKCGECGYTNDLNAWFCGVCGADVG